MDDEALRRLAQLYQAADALSVRAAEDYRRSLASISIASTILTIAFLLYDEAEVWSLIVVVGAMLVCEALTMRLARRSRCHERYVQYRVLAECLRVESYLHYGGVRVRASDILPWSLRQDLAWVEDVLLRWEQESHTPETPHDVRGCWIESQRNYHANAIVQAERRCAMSQLVVRVAMVASALLYVFTLLFELACGGWAMPPVVSVINLDLWRAVLKIALGSASAATIFVGSYVDKLSLDRVLDDHRKMERLYARALELVETTGASSEFLLALAREELVENSNWYAYQQANDPEMAL